MIHLIFSPQSLFLSKMKMHASLIPTFGNEQEHGVGPFIRLFSNFLCPSYEWPIFRFVTTYMYTFQKVRQQITIVNVLVFKARHSGTCKVTYDFKNKCTMVDFLYHNVIISGILLTFQKIYSTCDLTFGKPCIYHRLVIVPWTGLLQIYCRRNLFKSVLSYPGG